jgi:spore germination cell wall hydrolase CwlJ-like protein
MWKSRFALAVLAVFSAAAASAQGNLVLSTANARDPIAEAFDDAWGMTQRHPVAPPIAAVRPRPRPDVPRIRYDRAFLAAMPVATGDAEWRCLTEALYFEARGEDIRGIFAVAEVILNRVDSKRFPSTVCGVVHQGTGEKYQCQFTYTCDGLDEAIREPRAWARVGKVARLMLDGAPRVLTDGATHYHTLAVDPRWARTFSLVSTIGEHHFYRMPG